MKTKDVIEFADEAGKAAESRRRDAARSFGVSMCYYIGKQWIDTGVPIWQQTSNGVGRYFTNWNPDTNKLRATVNRVTKHVIKEAAATHPEEFEVEVDPPVADLSTDCAVRADVLERLAASSVRDAKLVSTAQDVNHMRVLCGLWGVGFYLMEKDVTLDGVVERDQRLRSFDFDPCRLILDPAARARNLNDHEWVIYEDVWTLAKIQRVYGKKFDASQMKTVGQLMPAEVQIGSLSGGSLYSTYWSQSNSKATLVRQVHMRDASGRFSEMHVLVQNEKGDWESLNENEPVSPFGGSGLPFALLHGHRAPMSIWSLGAGQMTKDEQDRINLLMSLFFRQLQAHSGYQTWVDKRLFPNQTSADEIKQQISNRVGGVVIYESRADKGIQAPMRLETPAPQPFIMDAAEKFEGDMRGQTFRTQSNFGEGARSHVPFQTTQRLLEEGDQVLGIRVREDTRVYTDLIRTLVGTNLRLVKQGRPGVLASLREDGFGPDDFEMLLTTPENASSYDFSIRESSVRQRPLSVRQSELAQAAQLQAITPGEWRDQLAALDSPLTAEDEGMYTSIRKLVARCVMGDEWQPMPLGRYNGTAQAMLRAALISPSVARDPAASQRLMSALTSQIEAQSQEQMLMQSAQVEAQASLPTNGAAQPQSQSVSLNDLLSEFDSQSAGGGQPSAVPAP